MVDRNWWQPKKIAQALMMCLIVGIVVLTISGCNSVFGRTPDRNSIQNSKNPTSSVQRAGSISEVSPPAAVQQLHQLLENRQPQVTILNPQPDEIFQDETINVHFQVQDLPVFKNQELNLGPHLNVILDNEPYINIYNLNEPLVLTNLSPGTHTLRVFAVYPWEESFKNEGAYAQTTFHIFAKNQNNAPAPEKPLLTYNTPQGSYGAQPILLDFFLSNAPLHMIAQADPQDDVTDWRIRCTVNGESFIIDRWQPLYLEGFKPGRNWVQLEFLDEQGNLLPNAFNNTIRVISYEPTAEDTLSKLMSGQLSATQARGIVDPNAVLPDIEPQIDSNLDTEKPSEVIPSQPESIPETQSDRILQTDEDVNQDAESDGTDAQTNPEEIEIPAVIETTPVEPELTTRDAVESEVTPPSPKPKGGYFNRFRHSTVEPSPVTPTLPEIIEPSSPAESPAVESDTPYPESIEESGEPADTESVNSTEL